MSLGRFSVKLEAASPAPRWQNTFFNLSVTVMQRSHISVFSPLSTMMVHASSSLYKCVLPLGQWRPISVIDIQYIEGLYYYHHSPERYLTMLWFVNWKCWLLQIYYYYVETNIYVNTLIFAKLNFTSQHQIISWFLEKQMIPVCQKTCVLILDSFGSLRSFVVMDIGELPSGNYYYYYYY